METQFIFRGWLRFILASLGRGSFLLGTVLLSLSSLIYAVEKGEYRYYLGLAISGTLLSNDLQKVDFTVANTVNLNDAGLSVIDSDLEEGGSLLVWDIFDLDNRGALSLMSFSVGEDESWTLSDGTIIDEERIFSGPLVVGKYFTQSGLYIGGGGALLSLSGDTRIAGGSTFLNSNGDLTSDPFFAPTLVLGYRGLVSRFENSHFYIGADWIRTLPTDVDYESSPRGITFSNTLEDLTISMLAVSFGWAW